jgi:hypothetical protein
MSHQFREGIENTCEGCPVIAVIHAELEALSEGRSGLREDQVLPQAIGHALNAVDINLAAGAIGCRNIPKQLPEAPDPMPPLASPERVAYGRHCLAWLALKRSRVQGQNN